MTATAPTLHVPDEPTAPALAWRRALAEGEALESVLGAEDGLVPWLWRRWSSLAGAGLSHEAFEAIALGYRRELWLWLAGERTWAQACSGLVGRLNRRMGQVDRPQA